MDKLYKLSFASKKAYEKVRAEILAQEDGNLKQGVHEIVGGHLPAKLEYDEQGNPTNAGELYPDWAVDIVSKEYIPELDAYLIPHKGKYMMSIAGGGFEIIEQKPTAAWLKADIQQWLTDHGTEWNTPMLKDELLNLV